MCSDELAVAATGQRVIYAETLALLGRRRRAPAPQLGAAIGGRKMALLHRVRNVLGLAAAPQRWSWWPAGLLALSVPLALGVTSLCLWPASETAAQSEEAEETAQPSKDPAEVPWGSAVGNIAVRVRGKANWNGAEDIALAIDLKNQGKQIVIPDTLDGWLLEWGKCSYRLQQLSWEDIAFRTIG